MAMPNISDAQKLGSTYFGLNCLSIAVNNSLQSQALSKTYYGLTLSGNDSADSGGGEPEQNDTIKAALLWFTREVING